ncbi:MAG: ABC-3 protein [Candidatus Woesebacteria bacterium GW2011_GWA1_37_8]|uniref:ABC-3 protein n=2 Tax=Candidatus Woeseibacteriota TaxID=1752722 RepID=A0A0G0NN16_9BACT|nr:MAG: ABC-3 protein [Microgenomates group bacterium GW2011_GWC1_37_12b]KKQ44129.1 MAG: ABC-3 protein [Candidatus Woesebacteria bacterium GW2011_GWA1_37_8]KKQ87284.1 MAG: ABC-3 protein [Candidatus Woesebacteria bacterium GW2011_GWB1_38_8b]
MENLLFLTIVGGFVAAASAYVGSIMVLKRMSLVGDALSHVALPGIAIALSLNISPILGAFTALTLAVLGIWYLEKNSDNYPEALVGIFFTASLAIGVLITDELDLLEALFGDIEKIGYAEGLVTIIISIIVSFVIYKIINKLIIGVISEELSKAQKININIVNLIYLLAVGVIASLGIKFVGTLLTGALVIIPAVAAKNISRSMKSYFLTSVTFGILSAIIGIPLAYVLSLPVGPIVVITCVIIFIITYLFKKPS